MSDRIETLAREWGPRLHCPDHVDGVALLRAIAHVESSYGTNAIPRHESAYTIGGYYYRRAKHVRAEFRRWGDWAACSYSSWQIMFITATELGYEDSPVELRKDHVAIPYVVKYLNKRVFDQGGDTVADAADAYNSGSFADQNVPEKYVAKVVAAYQNYAGLA